jgi:ribonuclease P protein component
MVIARLLHSADFERVLRTRAQVHSDHFAVHRLAQRPTGAAGRSGRSEQGELSTDVPGLRTPPVDDCHHEGPTAASNGVWWGAVVPKRHARRAVTRTLLKRQIRAAVERHGDGLSGGLWVVRLRAPFDRAHFISPASDLLKRSAREELDALLGRLGRVGAAHG